MRRIGFPWSPALVHRTRMALASSVLTAELALEHGLACSTAGGTHHAFYDYGSGFCIFNDLAVTARAMLRAGRARRVLIVDLDVHQGDGTASILGGDPDLFTFSMHCGANFPFHKQQSDLDVELPVGMEDDAYLPRAGRTSARSAQPAPARPGALRRRRGSSSRTMLWASWRSQTRGCTAATTTSSTQCLRAGVPVACVIGGGYSADIDALARRHSILHRAASAVWDEEIG